MAYKSIRTSGLLDRHGSPAKGDVRADRAASLALPGLRLELVSPNAGQVSASSIVMARTSSSVGREPAALLQRPQGAAAHPGARRPRRLGHRAPARPVGVASDIRKIEIDHDHGAIVKLNPLAEWKEDEVWDYLRENEVPNPPALRQGYTSIGCAPCTKRWHGSARAAGRWWWETDAPKECGMHCAIETGGFEHELHAILGEGSMSDDGRAPLRLRTERELALAETRPSSPPPPPRIREELAELSTRSSRALEEERATLEPSSSLRSRQAGSAPSRARRRAGGAAPLSSAAARGGAPRSARDVTHALGSLPADTLESASVTAVGPGAFTLSLTVEGRSRSARSPGRAACVGGGLSAPTRRALSGVPRPERPRCSSSAPARSRLRRSRAFSRPGPA